jgi:hypothetical protein
LISRIRELLIETLETVGPVILAVTILQFTIIKMPLALFLRFLLGAVMVIIGFLFFMGGIKIGLDPLGELIGEKVLEKGSVPLVMIISFVIGVAVTVVEPNVRVLSHQVDAVSDNYISKNTLVLAISLGVGVIVSLAILRIIKGIPITYLLFTGYLIIFVLSFFTPENFVPVAFDSGGVITGPIIVPFIISLGLGTASALGGRTAISDGFGLVGLVALGPIISVMVLGVIYG